MLMVVKKEKKENRTRSLDLRLIEAIELEDEEEEDVLINAADTKQRKKEDMLLSHHTPETTEHNKRPHGNNTMNEYDKKKNTHI